VAIFLAAITYSLQNPKNPYSTPLSGNIGPLVRIMFFLSRCQAKFLTCENSDFTPCAYAQINILHITCAQKADNYSLGFGV